MRNSVRWLPFLLVATPLLLGAYLLSWPATSVADCDVECFPYEGCNVSYSCAWCMEIDETCNNDDRAYPSGAELLAFAAGGTDTYDYAEMQVCWYTQACPITIYGYFRTCDGEKCIDGSEEDWCKNCKSAGPETPHNVQDFICFSCTTTP